MENLEIGTNVIPAHFAPTKDFWQSKRVYLTGHTGFKGAWLACWLYYLGAEVHGYALPPTTTESAFQALGVDGLCEHEIGDILDYPRLSASIAKFKPDIVLHLAAQSLVRYGYQHPLETFATNVQGTAHVLEACRNVPQIKAVVVVTTDKCYENLEQQKQFTEGDRLGGQDPYSSSKACAELVTHAYRQSYFATENRHIVASARAGNVIGGGDWSEDRLIPDAVRAWRQKNNLVIRSPQSIRPWQHVLSPLDGYLRLASALWHDNPEFSTAFNFGPEQGACVAVSQVINDFAKIWGGNAGVTTQEDPAHPHEARTLMLNSERAQSMLKWTPEQNTTLMLELTAAWYRAHYSGTNGKQLQEFTCAQIEQWQAQQS